MSEVSGHDLRLALDAYDASGQNISEAARTLGLPRKTFAGRLRAAQLQGLKPGAGEVPAAATAQDTRLERQNRELRDRLRHAQAEVDQVMVRLGLYERITDTPVHPPEWTYQKPSGREHHAIPSLLLTDIHWDEIVKPEQIDGVNKYNRAIAEARVTRAFHGSIKVLDHYVSGVTYDGISLMLGGDVVSGIIHEELTETNEGTIFESVVTSVEPIIAGIRLLAARFGRVDINCVVGNHGRRTRKPRAKNRVQDNFDWLIYKLIEREFRGSTAVTVHVAEAPDAHFSVYNTRYLLTHGDQFRGGSGISGAMSPLLLGTARKTRRQVVAGRPHDVMVMGHWHQSIWMPNKGLIVGGSVVGYGEFSYLINAEPEPPQCALWLNTPERGITVSAPVFVGDRKSEGW